MRIALAPGHGAWVPAAVAGGLREADVALNVALAAAVRKRHKAEVLLTRERDEYLSLPERARRANAWGADLFVSVHANADGGRGFESYRCPAAPERTRLLHAA
ncbi:MAG: N-acetylmuramoyl-L-alanine amidase, partial [Desulfotomaculales bacterium]